MAITQDDRIAFSLKIVSAAQEIKGLEAAKSALQKEVDKLQKLDTANKHIYEPIDYLTVGYQTERELLTGQQRTTITEQQIQDSAKRVLGNVFFPNIITTTVPSLVPYNNVWSKLKPFALTFSVGKTYVETYPGTVTKEGDLISAVNALISSASLYTDIQNTTGQECVESGVCDNILYTDEATCVFNGGIWTPNPDSIQTYPAVHTLKNNLITAVNNLKTFLLNEVTTVLTDDPNNTRQTQNNVAINNINNVIIANLNTWLAYSDFNTSHGQTTCAGFNAYDSNLLAPTKLHSTQLAFLQSSLNTRLSFITTRISQIDTNLGGISQNLTTGNINSSSGLYGTRYDYMSLRLNALGGSLVQLSGYLGAQGAQDDLAQNVKDTKAAYETIVRATLFKAPSNGTNIIQIQDASFISVGDQVYIYAEEQVELLRAVKAINGNAITLNDVVPAKYRPVSKARLYKMV